MKEAGLGATFDVLYGRTPARERTEPAHSRAAGSGLIFVPDHRLSEEMLKQMTHSFDHLLAIGMHRLYGWKIRAFGLEVDEYSSGSPWNSEQGIDRPRHFYCLNYENQPVDAQGVFEDEDALYRWWRPEVDEDTRKFISTDVSAEEIVSDAIEFGYVSVTSEQMAQVDKILDQLNLDQLHD